MKKHLKKIRKALVPKAKQAFAAAKQNKFALLQTALLIHISVRTEQAHALLTQLSTNLHNVFSVLMIVGDDILMNFMQARIQFEMAIKSIISLFGGDGA